MTVEFSFSRVVICVDNDNKNNHKPIKKKSKNIQTLHGKPFSRKTTGRKREIH